MSFFETDYVAVPMLSAHVSYKNTGTCAIVIVLLVCAREILFFEIACISRSLAFRDRLHVEIACISRSLACRDRLIFGDYFDFQDSFDSKHI
jgi:hypothetical protein